MKNREYWKERFELLEESQNRQGQQCYEEIEMQYRNAQREIETQINAWYGRFARNNKINLAEARKMLTHKELEELKWDVGQYIKHGEENAISGEWSRQLENASAKYHISRLESLKLHLQQSLEVMFGNQLDCVDSAMRNIYKSGYYHTAFEIQKGVGVGWNFSTLDDRRIAKVIHQPWAKDGRNFSERIWINRQKLINELNTDLTQNIILGQDPQKAIDAISKKMNVSKKNAGRLVMTEEAFFSSAAQKDCFEELDVEQFEVVATLDSHTSEICQEMDGKHFPMSEWEVGVTAPPFHVWCRSTTVPFFDDDFDSVGERAARGEDGKTYYVPADMTYKEWKENFVDKAKDSMSAVSEGIKWPQKKQKIDNDSYKNIMAHAREKGIELSGFKRFDGDIETVIDLIDDADSVASLYPDIKTGKRKLTIMLDDTINDEDFAITRGHIISINANAFRNTEILAREYSKLEKEDWFVKGSDYHSIIKHEIGHVVANIYGIDSLEIAMKIIGMSTAVDIMGYIKKNLSVYAAMLANGDEIIAESFSSVYGSKKKNEFALKFIEECANLILKR